MDLSFESADELFDLMDWTHDLTGLPDDPAGWPAPSLGALIPPELFEIILFYVGGHSEVYQNARVLWRPPGEKGLAPSELHIGQCSLVCRFWANKCRQYMFLDRSLDIRCREAAELFRRYAVEGSPNITPVHQLIRYIWVHQHYDSPMSFLHLLYLPMVRNKLSLLRIDGPIPDGLHPAMLDTPHWGIPSSVVLPCSFLPRTVVIVDIHLPSFCHVAKYIRYFAYAVDLEFRRITWDGEAPHSLPHAPKAVTRQHKPHFMKIQVKSCSDNVHLALATVMLNPHCPLHRLSDVERVWVVALTKLLLVNTKDPVVAIEFDVSKQEMTMCLARSLSLVLEAAPATDQSTFHLSGVRIAYSPDMFSGDKILPINCDALADYLRTTPTSCNVVLLFECCRGLREDMELYCPVLHLATEHTKFVVAYVDGDSAAGIGPVTL